jgi:hypothetical protein
VVSIAVGIHGTAAAPAPVPFRLYPAEQVLLPSPEAVVGELPPVRHHLLESLHKGTQLVISI